jgi:peptidoglycan L-alanyl-D-glutamate endopeptidase CwlK
MSYEFSYRSKKSLASAHEDLQKLFNEVIKIIDCTVIFGHRTEIEQEEQYRQGHTKLHYPRSKHNNKPSLAVDVVPYPINWDNRERFVYFAGIVKGIASQLDIEIRWGGDWDNDNQLRDQTWMDLPHYELL